MLEMFSSSEQKLKMKRFLDSKKVRPVVMYMYRCVGSGVPEIDELPADTRKSLCSRGFQRKHGFERWLAMHGIEDVKKVAEVCISLQAIAHRNTPTRV